MTKHSMGNCVCLALLGAMSVACTEGNRPETPSARMSLSGRDAGTDRAGSRGYCGSVDPRASTNSVLTDPVSGVSVLVPPGSFASDAGTVEVCMEPYSSEQEMPGYSPDGGVPAIDDAGAEQLVTLGAAAVTASAPLVQGASLQLTLPVPPGRQCIMQSALQQPGGLGLGIWYYVNGLWIRVDNVQVSYGLCRTVVRIPNLGACNVDVLMRLLGGLLNCGDAGTFACSGDAGIDSRGDAVTDAAAAVDASADRSQSRG